MVKLTQIYEVFTKEMAKKIAAAEKYFQEEKLVDPAAIPPVVDVTDNDVILMEKPMFINGVDVKRIWKDENDASYVELYNDPQFYRIATKNLQSVVKLVDDDKYGK